MMYADEFGVLRFAATNSELGQYAGSPVVGYSRGFFNKSFNET